MVHPLYDRVAQPVEELAERIEHVLDTGNRQRILGDRMVKALGAGSPRVLIKLALINDCLRIVEGVIGADSTAARRRLLSAFPLLRAIASYYARVRDDYRDYARLTPELAGRFIKEHYRDAKLFGNACERTRWLGRDICHRAAAITQDRSLLESYETLTTALMEYLLGPEAVQAVAAPPAPPEPPPPKASDSAIRRYQGFDVEDAEDHIDVVVAPAPPIPEELPPAPPPEEPVVRIAIPPPEPVPEPPPPPPPLPFGGYYLLPEGSGFTLRHGGVQVQYRPAGASPGRVSTDLVDTPAAGPEWQSLSGEHFDAIRVQVLAELRNMLEAGGAYELPPIDPWNLPPPTASSPIPVPEAMSAAPPLSAEDVLWEEPAVTPASGGSAVRLRVEEVSAAEFGVPAEPPAALDDVPIAMPVDPSQAYIPLAAPVSVPMPNLAGEDVPVATPIIAPAPVAVAPVAEAPPLDIPEDPVTRLTWAAVEGRVEHAASALDDGALVDDIAADYAQTPLMLAAARGHTRVVRFLLDRGAEVDRSDDSGRTAWMLAASGGHDETSALLIQRGAAPQLSEALSWAVRAGDQGAVDHLLDAGANPYQSVHGWTALTAAAALGHASVVRRLLDRGLDVHHADEAGRTAWVAARAHGQQGIAATLEQYGASPDVNAALLHAAHAGSVEGVRDLLAGGADANVGGTLDGEEVNCLEAVLRGAAGADPTDDELTQQWVECVHALLDAGLDVDRQTAKGRPLLIEAVMRAGPGEPADRSGSLAAELTSLLIARGADLEARDSEGATALIRAAASGQIETVRALLSAGAQPDTREPRTGRTALLSVCASGRPEGQVIAAYLIAYGALVQARGRDGKTALDLARNAYRDASPEASVVPLLENRDTVNRLASSLVNLPQTAKDFARRAETHRLLGDNRAAATDFEEAIRLEPARSSLGVSNWYEQRALAYAEQGERGPQLAMECGRLGRGYVSAGLLSGTLACYEEAIALDPRYTWPFNNLAWQLATWPVARFRNGAEAVRLATIACELAGWRCWSFLDTLAAAYAAAGRFEEAAATGERALALAPPDQHQSIRVQIGHYRAGKPWQSPDTSPELMLNDESHAPPAGDFSEETAAVRQLLADGQFTEAESAARAALADAEDRLGPVHPILSAWLWHLGQACREQGRVEEAEPIFRRGLLLAERSCGLDHPLTLAALQALALLCFQQDRDLEASCLFRRLTVLHEQTGRRDTPEGARALEVLGRSLWGQSRLAEAAQSVGEALATWRALPNADAAVTGTLMHHLGRLYFGLDRDLEAGALYEEALELMEQSRGPDSPAVADVLCDLADLHRYHGRAEEALPLLEQALSIRESHLGSEHEQTAQVRAILQAVCAVGEV